MCQALATLCGLYGMIWRGRSIAQTFHEGYIPFIDGAILIMYDTDFRYLENYCCA